MRESDSGSGGEPSGLPRRRKPGLLARYLPILDWGRTYNGSVLTNDLVAAIIVTIMLIPQSLAYALLAGLPPVVGLYASILPLVAYAMFGTSRTLAVGPVAVVSLMTASAAGAVAAQGTAQLIWKPRSRWRRCRASSCSCWASCAWAFSPTCCRIRSSAASSPPAAS